MCARCVAANILAFLESSLILALSEYSSVDEQVGLGGRISLVSSLVIENSSNSTFPFGGEDFSGGSSGTIEFSRSLSWWDSGGGSCWDSIGMMGSLFN